MKLALQDWKLPCNVIRAEVTERDTAFLWQGI